ncbi:MAG: FAD-binding oxidoreductase [Thermoplasmatales archaeon]
MKEFDTVIIGAGITGLASAYHIKKNNPNIRIAIIDRKPAFCQGNTAKSSAAFRNLFSSEINKKITQSTIEFYKHVQMEMGFDLGMHFNGYLFLGDRLFLENQTFKGFVEKGMARYVSESFLQAAGFRTKLVDAEASVMNLPNIDGGLLGLECGILSPEKICDYYGTELREMGVDLFFGTEAKSPILQPESSLNYPGEPFVWQKTLLKSLDTNRGEFTASDFIFCADIWTDALLDRMGIDGHTRGKKRQVFQIAGREVESMLKKFFIEGQSIMPLIVLPPYEIVLRPDPESKSIWVTIADEYNRDFSTSDDPQPEQDFYEKNLFPVITSYLPQLEESKVTSMWAGYYAYNTIDKTHYVFRDKNIIVATGSSGSGIMKADAIGRVVAALQSGVEKTVLFNKSVIYTSDLSVHNRKVNEEEMVI